MSPYQRGFERGLRRKTKKKKIKVIQRASKQRKCLYYYPLMADHWLTLACWKPLAELIQEGLGHDFPDKQLLKSHSVPMNRAVKSAPTGQINREISSRAFPKERHKHRHILEGKLECVDGGKGLFLSERWTPSSHTFKKLIWKNYFYLQ